MIFSKDSISDLLVNSKQMINIVNNDEELKKALVPYKYTEEKLNRGKEVYGDCERLAREYSETAGKKLSASAEFDNVRRQAHALFMEYLNLTRLAFRNEPEKLSQFKIPHRLARRTNAYMFQVAQFYQTVLGSEELLEKLSNYGVTKEKLQEGLHRIENAGTARETHKKLKGRCQDLKVKRDRALEELDDWVTELAMVCRYALKERPQMLEKLGIQVLSKGYRRQSSKKKEEASAA